MAGPRVKFEHKWGGRKKMSGERDSNKAGWNQEFFGLKLRKFCYALGKFITTADILSSEIY